MTPAYYDRHHSDDPPPGPAWKHSTGCEIHPCTCKADPQELAMMIVAGCAFTDEDAVRVARAFLEAQT
jgi:hypothetical protein